MWQKKENIGFLNIESDIFEQKNTFVFQPVIQDCEICYERKTVSQDFISFVHVDTIHTHVNNFDHIPKAICINYNVFVLIGLVVEVSLCDDTKHFAAHVKRGQHWYIFDNTSKSVTKSKLEKEVIKPHLRPKFFKLKERKFYW